MTDAAELGQQLGELLCGANRIAADECGTADDLVREEAAARRGEEVALVAPEAEEREAVLAVPADQPPDEPPFLRRLPDAPRERTEPQVEGARGEEQRDGGEDVVPAISCEAAQLEDEGQGREREQRECGREQRPDGAWIPGNVEAAPVAKQGDKEDEAERRLLDVQAFREVRDRDASDEGNRELPGAPAAPGEEAREPHEREPERKREDAGRARHSGRQDASHEVRAVGELRRQRRHDPDDADDGGSYREHPFAAERPHRHGLRVPARRGRVPPGRVTCLARLAAVPRGCAGAGFGRGPPGPVSCLAPGVPRNRGVPGR